MDCNLCVVLLWVLFVEESLVFIFLLGCEETDRTHVVELEKSSLAGGQLYILDFLWLAVFLVEEPHIFCNSCGLASCAAHPVGCHDVMNIHCPDDCLSVCEVEEYFALVLLNVHESYFICLHCSRRPSGAWGLVD